MLADALILAGRAGLKGGRAAVPKAWTGIKFATYGLSQAAIEVNLNRLDDFLAWGGDERNDGLTDEGVYPITEFEVVWDAPSGEEVIIPVSIQWKRTSDATIYSLFIASGTVMYANFVNYYWKELVRIEKLRQDAKGAKKTALAAELAQEATTIQTLIDDKRRFIANSKEFVKSIDAAESIVGVYTDTWTVLEAQMDDLANFDDLPTSKKAQYVSEIEAQRKANIKTAQAASDQASDVLRSSKGKFIKATTGFLDIGLFLGTGVLSLILNDEEEQMLLETVFGEDIVEKYNLTMPLGISDFILAVLLTELFAFFGDDLAELGVPATPETALAFALTLMGDYWKIVVDAPPLSFDLSEYFDTKLEDMALGTKLFMQGLESMRTDEEFRYAICELIIGVFALRVIWVTYGGLLMKAIGSGSPATA